MKENEKVALLGGGGVFNEFHIVRYQGELNENQIKLETNPKDLPNPFTPFLKSWKLGLLPLELKQLPLGRYLVTQTEIRDMTETGIFSTIYDGKVRATYNRETAKWKIKEE